MQINNEFAPVMKSSANMETAQASIAMTAHMFQILSAGIYQHPVRAVIRETSCNAYDAQVDAGNGDKPFNVHLPTQLEPYFEVRDFGTGMTHEQVMKLYLTYGASTKRDSNDLIGGLGIGSKSPFAIAQSFTVTSYVDGTVRRYSIYMEEGVPQVTKLTESQTSEPNGVAVRVAVPLDKINEFESEANRIYTHFPVEPNCNRSLTNIYKNQSVLAEEKDLFKVFSGDNRYGHIHTGIVMGNIEYPIELTDVLPDLDSVMPMFLRQNISHALIYLPIGAVNIAASRESLQLTDNTKEMIKQVFEKVSKQILKTIQNKLDAAPTLYDAVKIYFESVNKSADKIGLLNNLAYNGKTLLEWMASQDNCRLTEVIDPTTGDVVLDQHRKPKMHNKYEAVTGYRLRDVIRNSDKRLSTYSWNNAATFSIFRDMRNQLENTLFIIEDRFQKNGKPKSAGRTVILKKICSEFREKTPNAYDNCVFLFRNMKEIQALADLHFYPLDKLNIRKLSDYESAYVPQKAVRGQVKLWEAVNGNFREVRIDLDSYDDQQYYLKAEGQNLVSDTLTDGFDSLRDMMERLSRIIPGKQVFLFRKSVWDKIPEEWTELTEDVFKKLIKDNPDWWINYNRYTMSQQSDGKRPRLDRMNVKVVMSFNGKLCRDGYNDPRNQRKGINFEDNLDVMHCLFGRPQIIFADMLYKKSYNEVELYVINRFLNGDSHLGKCISKARDRAIENFNNERQKFKEKNKLLSWVDWSTVSLREVAEYFGHTLTPYVDK